MKRLLVASILTLAAVVTTADSASAQQGFPGNLGFLPYGFYQPYGARYGTSIRTPPYFSTNPPVYYGSRHARPYGISPFASPPVVRANGDYRSRLRMQFDQPRIPTPGPQLRCNPCVLQSDGSESNASDAAGLQVTAAQERKVGEIRTNPFVEPAERLAKK